MGRGRRGGVRRPRAPRHRRLAAPGERSGRHPDRLRLDRRGGRDLGPVLRPPEPPQGLMSSVPKGTIPCFPLRTPDSPGRRPLATRRGLVSDLPKWSATERKSTMSDKKFKGTITLDVRDSVADWEPYLPKKAPKGSPNILFVLYDDTGLAAWSPFGGKINMPTLQKLADNGLRYSQWHTTALCSPTRSTL